MKLTWRDGVATALMVGAIAVALAVTQGWNWTLLGSTKAGVAALPVTVDIVTLWFITTWRHAVVGVPEQPKEHELQAWIHG